MPDTKRNVVGEADPETRRKRLREILDTPTKATGVAPKSMKEAVDAGVEEGTEKPKKSLKRRFGPKGQTEDEIMEE